MLPVLPEYLTSVLKFAGGVARFLRDTGHGDAQAIADLEEIASRKGLGAAYARTRAAQGYLGFAEGTLRAVMEGAAYGDHAAGLPAGTRAPRMKQLLKQRPEPDAWRAQVLAAFAAALGHGKPPLAMVQDYLYGTAFAELDPAADRPDLVRALCEDHAAAALILLADPEALLSYPDVLKPLLRFGRDYFTKNRYFQKAFDLCHLHRTHLGLRGRDVGEVLDGMWYAAFRIGRHDAAMEALDHWSALRPTLKRPLVYRAIVTSVTDPEAALGMLEDVGADLGRATVGGNALYMEQAIRAGRLRAAETAMRHAIHEMDGSGSGEVPRDYLIALHNVLIARGRPSRALDAVFAAEGMSLRWTDRFGLDTVEDASRPQKAPAGRTAVIMTAYRAEAFLARAMAGVLEQTHKDLELIVVDDCSDDGTAGIVQDIAARDARVTYLRTPRNMGTYAAKNLGIRDALTRAPDFVTLCDSDDFWLRNHLAAHLEAMDESPGAVCSVSQWIRVRCDGTIEAGLRGRYVEACPHSTFFRAGVFDRVGLFDAVRFGADREFLNRISLHYGRQATIQLPDLVTLGRRHDASLTTSGAGAITEFNESPVRLEYWQSWNEWHIAQVRAGAMPRTEGDPDAPERPFAAPPEMHI